VLLRTGDGLKKMVTEKKKELKQLRAYGRKESHSELVQIQFKGYGQSGCKR
jgi:hypothetical protein